MADHNEFFHGTDYAERTKALEKDLALIEEKHIEFFKQREPKSTQDEYDRLHYHYIQKFGHGVHTFSFKESSDLPDYIKDECYAAVKRHFG